VRIAARLCFPTSRNLRSEDKIEPYPYSFQSDAFGKILSLLKAIKPLSYWGGSILTSFLVLAILENYSTVQAFKT
jgi:hypothetical protein